MASRNESSDESLVTPDDTADGDLRHEQASAPIRDDATGAAPADAEASDGVRAITEQARQARPQRRLAAAD